MWFLCTCIKNFIIIIIIKTHIQWNNLPIELKILDNYDKFKIKLEEHLWESILECDEQVQQN